MKALVTHGRSDPVIPFQMGELLNEVLSSSGIQYVSNLFLIEYSINYSLFRCEFIPFYGGHEIPQDVTLKFYQFIGSLTE